ncbi:hypothetical protein [Desulfoscipio gibsoniae]
MEVTMRNKLLLVCLIALLFIVAGCNRGTSHPSATGNMTPEQIPFVIFLQNAEEGSQINSDSAYLCRFDTLTGRISIDEPALFRRITQEPYNFRMIWDGEKKIMIGSTSFEDSLKLESINTDYTIKKPEANEVTFCVVIKNTSGEAKAYNEEDKVIASFENGEKQILAPPLPSGANQPQPLLLSGDEHNYRILIAFDVPSSEKKNEMVGKLLIANVKDDRIEWQEVRGEYGSFIAGAGSNTAKIGENIYITGCGGNVSVLNLQQDSPMLEEYKPANDLLLPLSDKFQEAPIQPHFGAYKNYLLVTVQNSEEKWLWILKDNIFLGKVHVNILRNQIDSYLANKQIETKPLPLKASTDLLQLPMDTCGTWK